MKEGEAEGKICTTLTSDEEREEGEGEKAT